MGDGFESGSASPRPPRSKGWIVPLLLLTGSGLSLQAFINGRLALSLGSATFAALANQTIGFTALVLTGLAIGAMPRAYRRLRTGRRPRWWHIAASFNGALYITVASATVPQVGVALFTVALVAGQSAGSLVVDRLGLSPAGRRQLNIARISSAALAMLAVGIGVPALPSQPHLGLLALVLAAGAGFPLSQAAVGHITELTGEPLAAGALNFGVSGVCLVVVAAIATRWTPPRGWAAAPVDLWLGGLIGAATVLAIAITVRALGVLRLALGLIAGQTVGGLIIDLLAPGSGVQVTTWTCASVLLTLLAVGLSGASPSLGRESHVVRLAFARIVTGNGQTRGVAERTLPQPLTADDASADVDPAVPPQFGDAQPPEKENWHVRE